MNFRVFFLLNTAKNAMERGKIGTFAVSKRVN